MRFEVYKVETLHRPPDETGSISIIEAYVLRGAISRPEDAPSYWTPGAELLGETFGAGDYLLIETDAGTTSYLRAERITVGVRATYYEVKDDVEGVEVEPEEVSA